LVALSIRQALILGCVLVASAAYAEPLTGRVVGVSDGDTITVLDAQNQQHKIRVAGIDAPEKKQSFGQRSKEHLSDLVFGKEVDVVGNKTDRYGRTVAKVMVASRDCGEAQCPRMIDAGLGQIEAGFAWWYRKYAREQTPEDRAIYASAEIKAREAKRGLWSEPNPMPPWEWRHPKAQSVAR
jgi:endonuclease YncB( thermonuclease family)